MTLADAWPDGLEAHWVRRYPVLGIDTVIEATDSAVAPAVERAFGAWGGIPDALRSRQTVRIRIGVIEGIEASSIEHAAIRYRLESPKQLRAMAPGGAAFADAVRGEAWARVSRALVADVDQFRYGIVEAMAYFLLSHLDRQPFHCAAVARGGRVLILSGAPGVGKSTLAYAASLRGFLVMAEDIVWIQQNPRFRVWGATPVIHLPTDAKEWFPSLADLPTLLVNGQRKISVQLGAEARARMVAEEGAVCVVERRMDSAQVTPIDRGAVLRALTDGLQPGFDLFPTTIPAVVAGLAPRGGWKLSVGGSPMEAVRRLDEIVDR